MQCNAIARSKKQEKKLCRLECYTCHGYNSDTRHGATLLYIVYSIIYYLLAYKCTHIFFRFSIERMIARIDYGLWSMPL